MQYGTFEKSQGTTKEHPYLLGCRQDQWTNWTLRSYSKAWLFSHACFKVRNWLCVSILSSKRKKYHIWIQTFINQRHLFPKSPARKLAKFCLYGFLYITKCNKMKCCLRNRDRFHEISLQKYICLEIRWIDHFGTFVFFFLSCLALAVFPDAQRALPYCFCTRLHHKKKREGSVDESRTYFVQKIPLLPLHGEGACWILRVFEWL